MKVLSVGMMVCDIPLSPVPRTIFSMEKAEIEPPMITTGGDALNVAVTLSKLGTETMIAGRVGLDDNGCIVMERAIRKGVDTRYVIRDALHPTAVSYLLIDESGEKHSLSNTEIYHTLTDGDIPDEAIRQADIVYFGSAFQMKGMDEGGTLRLFQRTHKLGRLTAMDAAMNDEMDSREALFSKLAPVFAETDIFLPSHKEAQYLTGCQRPEEMAEVFGRFGIKIFGVKMGEKGCYVTDYNESFHVKCFRGFPVVDTTGAGDSFVGGFLCGCLHGWDVKRCAEFASAVAAHNIAVKGATEGVPDFKTTMAFLKQNTKK